MRLDDNQRKKVEENHNLIYSFLNHKSLDCTEYYGLIAESLCKAVKLHDCSKGNLSTLFFSIANNDLQNEWRKDKMMKRQGENIPLDEELISVTYDLEDRVHTSKIKQQLLESEYGEVVQMRFDGYLQHEIAEKLGITQGTVSRLLGEVGELYERIK